MLLTVAALGMFTYGAYEIGWAVVDLIRGARLELWAELGLMAFGLLLVLAAAFVRVRLPGGLAFAIGALLGLQALAVHNAVHLRAGLAPQIGRGLLAVMLIGLSLVPEREHRIDAGGAPRGQPSGRDRDDDEDRDGDGKRRGRGGL
jgi:hypothetical protein